MQAELAKLETYLASKIALNWAFVIHGELLIPCSPICSVLSNAGISYTSARTHTHTHGSVSCRGSPGLKTPSFEPDNLPIVTLAHQYQLEALIMAAPSALGQIQPIQSVEQERRPCMVEGNFHSCEGQIERRSKILKRWKKEYIKVIPGIAICC